jgi:hypothetical protein
MEKSMIVCGTGTRQACNYSPEERTEIGRKVMSLLKDLGATKCISGGAQGFDYIIAVAAFKLGLPYTIMWPNPTYIDYYWNGNGSVHADVERKAKELEWLRNNAAAEVNVCQGIYQGKVHSNFIRNEAMVDESNAVIRLSGKAPSSGTHHCTVYALGKQKIVKVVSV